MKKITLLLTILILAFTIAACSSDAEENTTNSINQVTNPNDNFSFEIPLDTRLSMGTVKLDETEYAVDADQAAELLPLWKALRSLGESETAAQAEIDAMVSQIERSMTEDQLNAIQGMGLTMQNMGEVAETLGVEMAFGGFGGREMTPEMQATMEAARESGQFPDGGPGGGLPGSGQGRGQGMGGGAEMDPDARATAIAERGGARGARFEMNT